MEFSVEQIASFLHGEIVGDASIKVNNLSKIDDGKAGTLSFLANSKYTHCIYTTEASAVLVRRDFIPEQEVKTTLIKVDDPYACLALLLNMVDQATRPQKSGIEENVFVADSATLGENLYIGAFSYISNNASVGSNSKIYPQCYIGDNVKIGTNCIIYPGVKIYHNCEIGNNVIIHALRAGRAGGGAQQPIPAGGGDLRRGLRHHGRDRPEHGRGRGQPPPGGGGGTL